MGFSFDSIQQIAANEEREEGEIIEANEYEDISSDEEINLRERIQELEARNLELEKIASISSAKSSEYGEQIFFFFLLKSHYRIDIR